MDPVRRRRGPGAPAWAARAGDGGGSGARPQPGRRRLGEGHGGRRCCRALAAGLLRDRRRRLALLAALALAALAALGTRAPPAGPRRPREAGEADFLARHGDLLEAIVDKADIPGAAGFGLDAAADDTAGADAAAQSPARDGPLHNAPPADPDAFDGNDDAFFDGQDHVQRVPAAAHVGLRGATTAAEAAARNEDFRLSFVAGTPADDPRRFIVGQRRRFRCPGAPEAGALLADYQINDGYCDCPGTGFDEPGTPACSGMATEPLFFCGEEDGRWLPSAKVHDGICDCCDGVDEGPNQRDCRDTCAARRAANEETARQKAHAADIGKRLLQDVPVLAELSSPTSQSQTVSKAVLSVMLGSPSGGKLEVVDGLGATFEVDVAKSGSMSQRTGRRGRPITLGKQPQWNLAKESLELRGGQRCSNGIGRAAKVTFQCAHDNAAPALVSVVEPSTCAYVGVVRSAFGCLLDLWRHQRREEQIANLWARGQDKA